MARRGPGDPAFEQCRPGVVDAGRHCSKAGLCLGLPGGASRSCLADNVRLLRGFLNAASRGIRLHKLSNELFPHDQQDNIVAAPTGGTSTRWGQKGVPKQHQASPRRRIEVLDVWPTTSRLLVSTCLR